MAGHNSTLSVSTTRSINLIAACVVNVIFALGGTFLNSLVIMVFFSSSSLRSNVSYFLIMVLSCTDLVVVLVVHPLIILNYINMLRQKPSCMYETLYSYSSMLLGGLSGYALLAMNVERYVAIVHPFFYERKVTKRKLLLLLALFWIFVVTWWLFCIHFTLMIRFTVVSFTATFFLITLPVYAKILVLAKQKRNQMKFITPNSSVPHEQTIRRYKEHLKEVKFALMYVLIVLCALVCYCPTAVFYGFKYTEFKPCNQSPWSGNNFLTWSGTVITMNSTFNCLIFFWKNRTLRNEGKKILLKCCRV